MKQLTPYLYEFETSPENVFNLAFLPGVVALYGKEFFQYFLNEKDLTIWHLELLFPDELSISGRATLYKEGRTNKVRFKLGAEASTLIPPRDKLLLKTFIDKCDCAPSVVRQKLAVMGFGRLVSEIQFEDLSAEMEVTVGLVQHLLTKELPRWRVIHG